MSETFTLYRFFAADDVLLYVGRTVNPGRRMEKHRATQPWWPDVARIEMEQHPDLVTLLAAEREAIEAEKPLHNIRMNGKPPQRSYAEIVWTCDVCHLPIADDDGYVTVDYADLHKYTADVRIHDERMEAAHPEWAGGTVFRSYTLSELWDWPATVEWHTYHRQCDPDIDSCDYTIDVERIRTPGQALWWAAHLLEKVWITNTDWDHVLRRIAAQAGVGKP